MGSLSLEGVIGQQDRGVTTARRLAKAADSRRGFTHQGGSLEFLSVRWDQLTLVPLTQPLLQIPSEAEERVATNHSGQHGGEAGQTSVPPFGTEPWTTGKTLVLFF
jgi:hypothetical protein